MKTLTRRFTLPLLLLLFSLPAHAQPATQTPGNLAVSAMKQIHEEHLTAQAAWDKGILNREVLISILDSSDLIDSGRGLFWPGRESDELVPLFLKQFPEEVEKARPLSTNATIRIAIYRMNHGDAKGAQTLEDMVDAMPRQNPDLTAIDAMLYSLSNYYAGSGQGKKAVETVLKIKEFTENPLVISNQLLQAARVSWDIGDKAGATSLYNEVIACGYGWATGHAYLDMYRHKSAEGKLEEARDLLKTQFEGINADQIRVIMYNTLAGSYLDSGDWDEATHWAQATIDQFKAIAVPLKGYGIDSFSADAERMLTRIELYKKTPLIVEPAELTLTPRDAAQPTMMLVTIRAQKPITATFTSPDPNFTALLMPQPKNPPSHTAYFYIQVSPQSFAEDHTVELTFTAKEFPDTVLKVPVHLKKPAPIPAP